MEMLQVHDWEQWQSYRKDRGQPPWIKLHRGLLRNPKWVTLSDAERGQLVSIWLLAADNDGKIPADAALVQRMCLLSTKPKLNKFKELSFLETPRRQGGANMTPGRRQDDAPEVDAEADTETEAEAETEAEEKKIEDGAELSLREPAAPAVVIRLPTNEPGIEYEVTTEQVAEFQPLYPAVDVRQQLREMRGWLIGNQRQRKTLGGMPRFITAWLAREQNKTHGKGRSPPADSAAARLERMKQRIREEEERERAAQ